MDTSRPAKKEDLSHEEQANNFFTVDNTLMDYIHYYLNRAENKLPRPDSTPARLMAYERLVTYLDYTTPEDKHNAKKWFDTTLIRMKDSKLTPEDYFVLGMLSQRDVIQSFSKQEKEERFTFLQQAESLPEALNEMGLAFSAKKDQTKAREFHEAASKQAVADAYYQLYFIDFSSDKIKSISYLQNAASLCSSSALQCLSTQNIEGAIVSQTNNLAIKYCQAAATYLNRRALNSIGLIYYEGTHGFKRDLKKAEDYFQKATARGCLAAIAGLANIYAHNKDFKKAENYLKKAIQMGLNYDPVVFHNFAFLYYNQISPRDNKNASKYSRACVAISKREYTNSYKTDILNDVKSAAQQFLYNMVTEENAHFAAQYHHAMLQNDCSKLRELFFEKSTELQELFLDDLSEESPDIIQKQTLDNMFACTQMYRLDDFPVTHEVQAKILIEALSHPLEEQKKERYACLFNLDSKQIEPEDNYQLGYLLYNISTLNNIETIYKNILTANIYDSSTLQEKKSHLRNTIYLHLINALKKIDEIKLQKPEDVPPRLLKQQEFIQPTTRLLSQMVCGDLPEDIRPSYQFMFELRPPYPNSFKEFSAYYIREADFAKKVTEEKKHKKAENVTIASSNLFSQRAKEEVNDNEKILNAIQAKFTPLWRKATESPTSEIQQFLSHLYSYVYPGLDAEPLDSLKGIEKEIAKQLKPEQIQQLKEEHSKEIVPILIEMKEHIEKELKQPGKTTTSTKICA